MHKIKFLAAVCFLFISVSITAQFKYPKTLKVAQVDDYFGTNVADPYRWLEDDKSVETKNWVDAQNEVTQSYLNNIPYRKQFQDAIEKVFNYPKYSAPFRNGEWYYFYKNDGLQNQSVLYRQKGLKAKPELVIDPNILSPDGTTRLQLFNLNKNGQYAVVGLSKGGSDWQTYYVRDMATGKNLTDELNWVKISGASWAGNGFYYSRYPAPETNASGLSAKNENHMVYFHKVGTAQSEDILVFEDKVNPQRFHTAQTSEDERFLYLYISDRGKGLDGNSILFRDLKSSNNKFKTLIPEISNDKYNVIENTNNNFIIKTTAGATNGKLITIDINAPNIYNAKVLIAEKQEPLQQVSSTGGKLFLSYLKDVSVQTYMYNFEGKLLNEIKYPGLGNASGFSGNYDDKFCFYSFTSFTYPPTIYKFDIVSGKTELYQKPEVSFDPSAYETSQVFYPSKDGTKIPMFLVHKKGLKLNGNNVTLLYAYGGFNISMLPSFTATLIPFLDAGAVYAMANIRGGGEYGDKWHEAGMQLNKQNVFDDFIAAGEYLIEQKYTSAKKLAIRGGSNGGLLVGTVINQRPELFGAAIAQVGVMDMLRFQKFTIGWNWIADYGSSEKDEAHFKNLLAYSPLHNIKPGINYPATLVTTADHDDRVVPAHSFKYISTLQEMYTGKNPVLIRIDTNSGHGASNTKKNIELIADIYSFIFYNMGVEPIF